MRLPLSLLAAALVSFAAGFAAVELTGLIPCSGEGLACNINDAVGAYAVMIWSALGPVIFGLILLIAKDRVSLASGVVLLLAPLVVFTLLTQHEAWQTIGFEPYKNFRQVMTMFVPPAITVVTQWLVLRYLLARGKTAAAAPREPETKPAPQSKAPGPRLEGGGFTGFPTE